MSEAIVSISHPSQLPEIIGSYDENFTILQREFDVVLFCRGADVHITGEEAQTAKAASALRLLEDLAAKGQHLTEQTVRYVISMVAEGEAESVRDLGKRLSCM